MFRVLLLPSSEKQQVPSLSGRVCCIAGCTDLALAAPSVEWRQSAAKDQYRIFSSRSPSPTNAGLLLKPGPSPKEPEINACLF